MSRPTFDLYSYTLWPFVLISDFPLQPDSTFFQQFGTFASDALSRNIKLNKLNTASYKSITKENSIQTIAEKYPFKPHKAKTYIQQDNTLHENQPDKPRKNKTAN